MRTGDDPVVGAGRRPPPSAGETPEARRPPLDRHAAERRGAVRRLGPEPRLPGRDGPRAAHRQKLAPGAEGLLAPTSQEGTWRSQSSPQEAALTPIRER